MVMKGSLNSPNLQDGSLFFRLFRVISRTFVGRGSYPFAAMQSVYSAAPADRAIYCIASTKNKIASSSSLCRAASKDIPDPLSPSVSIIHRSREVFKAIFCISTELLYIGSSWSPYLYSSMWRGPQEYVTYEFVLISPAVSHMSGLFNLDSFRDGS